jgi:hypothetical protein
MSLTDDYEACCALVYVKLSQVFEYFFKYDWLLSSKFIAPQRKDYSDWYVWVIGTSSTSYSCDVFANKFLACWRRIPWIASPTTKASAMPSQKFITFIKNLKSKALIFHRKFGAPSTLQWPCVTGKSWNKLVRLYLFVNCRAQLFRKASKSTATKCKWIAYPVVFWLFWIIIHIGFFSKEAVDGFFNATLKWNLFF